MSRINLLPWREELRKKLNKYFMYEVGKNVILSIFVVLIIDNYLNHRIDVNNADIAYINAEMQKMSPQMTQLENLEKSKKQILERIGIIQSLQQDRFSIVKLLDILPRHLPDSVYLTLIARRIKLVPITSGGSTQTDQSVLSAGGSGKPDFGGKGGGTGSGGRGGGGGARAGKGGGGRGGTPGVPSSSGSETPATPASSAMPSLGSASKKGGTSKKKGSTDPGEGMKEKYAITLEGISGANTDIAVFLKNLQSIKEFNDVTLNDVSADKGGGGLHFQIQFTQEIGI